MLFRPGGHGALIENLNQQDADIVFIKNIDNVVPDRLKKDTVHYKQVPAGVLVTEQKRIFERLQDPTVSDEERARLNRPIRVCGVVKNTGNPVADHSLCVRRTALYPIRFWSRAKSMTPN